MFTLKSRSTTGQAALLMSLSLMAMLGVMGLVVDVGLGHWRKEACKTAAEAAAFAAIKAVENASLTCNLGALACQSETACPASPTLPPANNIGNACLYAKKDGYTYSANQVVTVEAHGPDGIHSPVAGVTPDYWVSVTVGENVPQLFSAILGQRWSQVRARATGALFQQTTGACVYVLDNTNKTTLDMSGNPNVQASCGIYVNSPNNAAIDVGGSSAVVNASKIRIVGNYTTHGTPSITPSPSTGQTAIADPFANVADVSAPAGHGCDSNIGLPPSPIMPADGYYRVCNGGFTMNGNPSINLPAGIYIIEGGSIDLHNGTLTGSGVTFYLTGSFSGMTINGDVDINLSAPTSGPTKGLLFYQNRHLAVGAFSSKINGDSGTNLNGSLYFPTTSLTYSGGSSTSTSYTAIVAWDVAFQGNSYFASDVGGSHTALGIPKLALVE